ncbi:MAG: hypothetical protein ACE14V_02340 [bacterium]
MKIKPLFGLTILFCILFVGNTFAAYTWSTTTPLPVTIAHHGSAVYNQHLYVVSGYLSSYFTDQYMSVILMPMVPLVVGILPRIYRRTWSILKTRFSHITASSMLWVVKMKITLL